MPTLGAIARAWGRIGIVGFGGPPAHIALLRELVVDRRRWMRPEQFEDGLAAVNLLPGPASTQLAIYTAWRTGGPAAAVVGGLAFIVPGLVLIVALAALFLGSPPDWIRGAGAGAGAAVAAVAVHAGILLLRPAWARVAPAIRSSTAFAGAGAAVCDCSPGSGAAVSPFPRSLVASLITPGSLPSRSITSARTRSTACGTFATRSLASSMRA